MPPADESPIQDGSSAMERVRLRVCKMIHLERLPSVASREGGDPGRTDADPEVDLKALAGDLDTIGEVLDKCDLLVAQAWSVAVSLNAMRRRCRNCEQMDLLSEAIGLHQGVLNQLQQNLRVAARAIAHMRGQTSRVGVA